MKMPILLPALVLLLATACHKNETSGPDLSSLKITSISHVGKFAYDGDKLMAIGNQQYIYEGERLAGARETFSDTVRAVEDQTRIHHISRIYYKYSFKWVGNKFAGTMLDTMISVVIQDGVETNRSELRGIPVSSYFYKDDRLDSIALSNAPGTMTYGSAVKYAYDSKGNIASVTTYKNAPAPFPPVVYVPKIVGFFTYDDHPNPYYLLYKKYGFILPALEGYFVISPNNPVKMEGVATLGNGSQLVFQENIGYEYGPGGYPVKIINNKGPYENYVTITY